MTGATALVAVDPDTGRVMPGLVIGVEQEYKWQLAGPGLLGNAKPTLDDLERVIPPPDDSTIELRFRHTQSTVYFDDDWRLTGDRVALRAMVNPGSVTDVAWLGVKQTIRWENGCRDSLEVSERMAANAIGRELDAGQPLALTYARRLVRAPIEPAAFASVVQHRHKVFYRDGDAMLLQVTFDVSEVRVLPRGETVTTYWLEIETNDRDLRARNTLDRWAAAVSERLGSAPTMQAKSELAATMAGWSRAA